MSAAFASSRRRAEVAPRVGVLVDVRVRRPRRAPRRPRRLAPDWIQRVPGISESASSAFTSSTSLKRSSCRIRRRTISRKCSSSSESSSDHVAGVNSALGVVIVPHPRWVPHPLVTALTKKIIGPLDNQSSPTSPRHCLGRARLSDHPRRHRGDPKIVAGSRAGGDIARESPRPGRRRRRQRRDLAFLPSGPFASEQR